MVNTVDGSTLRIVRIKGLSVIDDRPDQGEFLRVVDRFVKFGNVYQLADGINNIVTKPARMKLFQIARMVVPPHQQMEYSALIPNYSAPSSVCTSDSGGGSSDQSRMRTIRLHRRPTGSHPGPPNFGFSVRGGREHGTGFFVSAVEQASEAHCQGLKIGDQIMRINGYSVVDAVHQEVFQYIKSQNHLELRVRTVGMIPVKDKRTDPLTWRVVQNDRLHSPPELCTSVCQRNSDDVIRDVRLFLNVAPRTKLECGICKGPEWKPGIFVQFTKENGLAREAGLQPGDQILQCNGIPFLNIPFSDAVNILKTSRQLDLIIRKGSGLDLFPGESSGYNSSASSANGDQSPNWGENKRLSIVKEESVEMEERLGQLDSKHRVKSWDQIECDWEKAEPNQKRRNSPVLRVHFKENGSDHNVDETNRDMSELSLVSSGRSSTAGMDAQNSKQKCTDNTKLAKICVVSQHSETKTVVVEVHRSEEPDDSIATSKSTFTSERLAADEDYQSHNSLVKSPSVGSFVSVGSSSASSSLSSAISQELQRRSKLRENEGCREPERKKDILKAIVGEKRQQHEQLMDEFKRVHRKMFAHSAVTEDNGSTCFHSEETRLKTSHTTEERELVKTQRSQKDEREEKVSYHRTSATTKEHTSPGTESLSQIRDVSIVTKNSSDVPPPPPPPPMPTSESESSSSSWKSPSPALSLASSLNGRPPSCPTPDYDTSSSSSVSSPAVSLSTISRNSALQGKHSSSQTCVNTPSKPLLNPQSRLAATNLTKTSAATSQSNPQNADAVEMQSIESFTLKNPQSPKPKPPETYFVPARNKNKTQNSSSTNQSTWRDGRSTGKQRPVSVTIGEYPSGVERRIPTRFDFLPAPAADVRKSASSVDGSNISCQLQSELAQTLSRSNLRKQTDSQDSLQNGTLKQTASAKGTVTVSVNCQHPGQNSSSSRPPHSHNGDSKATNSANKIHVESDNNPRNKLPVTSAENKTHVPGLMKPAIQTAADKLTKSLGTNNRVTITVPNGVKSSE